MRNINRLLENSARNDVIGHNIRVYQPGSFDTPTYSYSFHYGSPKPGLSGWVMLGGKSFSFTQKDGTVEVIEK